MYIQDATFIAIISAVTTALAKIIDIGYTYFKNKTSSNTPDNRLDKLIESYETLNEKFDKSNQILSKQDQDGVHLIYTPRRLITQQDEYNQLLRNLTYNSETVAKTLDRLTATLENIVRVVDKLEDRTHRTKDE